MAAIKRRAVATMGRLRGRAATVVDVRVLSPRIRVIRLGGEALRDLSFRPGQKIKMLAGDAMRSYTPSRVDTRAGWMDVVFFLHGEGPAARWAQAVRPGAETRFFGPASSMPEVTESIDWGLFLGDETTLGLAVAVIGGLAPGMPVVGAIESAEEDAPAIRALGLPLHSAVRGERHGASLSAWLDARLAAGDLPSGRGAVWLSGEATSVLALRGALLAGGFARDQLKIKPYWSVRGHAHRKTLGARL